MFTGSPPSLIPPTPDQRRQAALHFDRASQLVATGCQLAGIRLFVECCRLDPANLLYRQALRRAEKAWFGNRPGRGWWTWLFSWRLRRRLRAARAGGRYLEVLDLGEQILIRAPWDVDVQMEMATAAELLGLLDLAIWNLEQARQKDAYHPELNRRLARLYERRGNFTQAQALWELVRKVAPDDEEAAQKLACTPAGREGARDQLAEKILVAQKRLREEPAQPEPYLELARLLRDAGQLDEAQRTLSQGLQTTGNCFDLLVEWTELSIEPFRRDLALTQARLTSQPGDSELLRIQHELRREINIRELELYRMLADRYPGRLVYRYEVGLRLVRAGQLAEAREELQALRGHADLEGPALVALAHGFRDKQHLRLAQKHFEEALACLPPEGISHRKEALYELARCHADLGELPRAVSLADELLRLDPTHRDIRQLAQQWQVRAEQAQAS